MKHDKIFEQCLFMRSNLWVNNKPGFYRNNFSVLTKYISDKDKYNSEKLNLDTMQTRINRFKTCPRLQCIVQRHKINVKLFRFQK